jgi:shikimate dehydrogenase
MSRGIRFAGILGWPVKQSLSPVLHSHWIKENDIAGSYVALAVRREEFESMVKSLPSRGFVGANVTIPHKEAAFALASDLDEDARATGAVNVLVFESGKVRGMNTDARGFLASLKQSLGQELPKRGPAVVLGAGGAARAIVLALTRAGVPEIRIVNRTREKADALAAHFKDKAPIKVFAWGDWRSALSSAALLVNTTSLGMTGKPPLELSLDGLPQGAGVVDIVYNPLETDLLRRARSRGHPVADGLGMLMYQAVPAFATWFGITPRVTPALRSALEEALRRG